MFQWRSHSLQPFQQTVIPQIGTFRDGKVVSALDFRDPGGSSGGGQRVHNGDGSGAIRAKNPGWAAAMLQAPVPPML